MKELEILRIILDAFHLDEWIDGNADGGITPPRIILKIEMNMTDERAEVRVEYKYPAESHPYSDVTYHISEPDKRYSSTYVLTNNRKIYRKDSDKLFAQDDVWPDITDPKIAEFFSENQVEEAK